MFRKLVELERELRHSFDLKVLNEQDTTTVQRMWLFSLYMQARTLILRNAIRKDIWIYDGLNVLMSLAVNPGDIVFDLGANVGWRTEKVAWLVGKSGKVHSFEPSPTACQTLRRRLICMGLSNVVVNQVALGAESSTAILYEYADNYGGSSSLRTGAAPDQHLFAETPVVVETLDDYVKQNAIENVTLVKIDVQGSEIDVLHGAKRFLNKPTLPILFIEIEKVADEAFGYSVNDLLNLIKDLGYELYSWRKTGLITVSSEKDIPPDGHDDVICLSANYHEALRKKLHRLAMNPLLKVPSQL